MSGYFSMSENSVLLHFTFIAFIVCIHISGTQSRSITNTYSMANFDQNQLSLMHKPRTSEELPISYIL